MKPFILKYLPSLIWAIIGGLVGGGLGLWLNGRWPLNPMESGVLFNCAAIAYALWLCCRP